MRPLVRFLGPHQIIKSLKEEKKKKIEKKFNNWGPRIVNFS